MDLLKLFRRVVVHYTYQVLVVLMDLLILCFVFLLSFRLKHWRMNSVTAINVHPNILLYPYLVICSQ